MSPKPPTSSARQSIQPARTLEFESIASPDPSLTYKSATGETPFADLSHPERIEIDSGGEGAGFRLISSLGEGGMGVVWRALQVSLQREVALKKCKVRDARAKQFLAEGMITARLEHPNIIPVHALGKDDDGNLYLSMKLAQGIAWKDLLKPTAETRERAKAMKPDDHLRILISVANAVAYAHRRGVIHRDLKPANVIIGTLGEVWLCDWGIAIADGVGADQPGGTPAYVSPEQACGDSAAISPRTDIYLLGAILFEIVTGKPPHRAATSKEALMHAASGIVPDLGPEIPGELAELIRCSMAADPSERPESAEEFRNVLEDYLHHRESRLIAARAKAEARALGRGADKDDQHRRYSRHAMVVARFTQAIELWPENAAALAGGVAARLAYAEEALKNDDFGLALAQLREGDEASPQENELADRIESRRMRQKRERRLARRIRTVLITAIIVAIVGAASAMTVIARSERRAADAETAAAKQSALRLTAELAEADRARRRVRAQIPYSAALDLLLRDCRHDEAAKRCREALVIDPDFAEAQLALGQALRRSGDPTGAAKAFLAADKAAQAATGAPNIAALLAAGFCLDGGADYAGAERAFTAAGAAGDQPLAQTGRSFVLYYHGRIGPAVDLAEAAVKAAPDFWECHLALGCLLSEAGKNGWRDPRLSTPRAIAELRRAIELAPTQAEPRVWMIHALDMQLPHISVAEQMAFFDRVFELEPRNGNRHVDRALMLINIDRRDDALKEIAAAEKLDVSPNMLLLWKIMLSKQEGRNDDFLKSLDQMVRLAPEWGVFQINRFMAYLSINRRADIAEEFKRWSAANEDFPLTHYVRGWLQQQSGDLKGAMESVKRGLALAPWNISLIVLRANVLASTGKIDEAVVEMGKAAEWAPDSLPLFKMRLDMAVKLRRAGEARRMIEAFAGARPDMKAQIDEMRSKIPATGE